jgi:hypothetical protein
MTLAASSGSAAASVKTWTEESLPESVTYAFSFLHLGIYLPALFPNSNGFYLMRAGILPAEEKS